LKLTVKERFVALSILPAQGNFVTLKVMRKLREKLTFSEEEMTFYSFVMDEEGESVTWDEDVRQERDIDLTTKEFELLHTELSKLDTKKTLQDDQFTLYEKLIVGED